MQQCQCKCQCVRAAPSLLAFHHPPWPPCGPASGSGGEPGGEGTGRASEPVGQPPVTEQGVSVPVGLRRPAPFSGGFFSLGCGRTGNLSLHVWGFGWRSVLFLDFLFGLILFLWQGGRELEGGCAEECEGMNGGLGRGMGGRYLVKGKASKLTAFMIEEEKVSTVRH
jgi:hypothetical protein